MCLSLNGNKYLTLWNGKPFQFVFKSSVGHLKKIEDHKDINCMVMKYVKVPSLEYGVVMTICTLKSIERKKLYEVSILNYPSCSCLYSKFTKVRANWKC